MGVKQIIYFTFGHTSPYLNKKLPGDKFISITRPGKTAIRLATDPWLCVPWLPTDYPFGKLFSPQTGYFLLSKEI
jgi:hypothetical protein